MDLLPAVAAIDKPYFTAQDVVTAMGGGAEAAITAELDRLATIDKLERLAITMSWSDSPDPVTTTRVSYKLTGAGRADVETYRQQTA